MSNLCQWCRAPEHAGNCDREALKELIRLLRLEAEVAAGAYADAFIFNFLKEKLEQPDGVAVQIIQEFRAYRDELLQEFKKDQEKK